MLGGRWRSVRARLGPKRRSGRTKAVSRAPGPWRPRSLGALEWLEPRTLLSGGSLADFDSGDLKLSYPVAGHDYYWTPADTKLEVAAPGLLANDYDPDGHRIEALNVYGNLDLDHGTLFMDAWRNDGSFDYVPFSGHNGQDTFTYLCIDEYGYAVEATVTIDVGIFNHAPHVADPIDDVTVDQGAPDTVIDLDAVFDDVDIPGGDQLTYSVTVSPPILPIVEEVSQSSYEDIHGNMLYTHLGDSRGYESEQHDLARDNIQEYFEDLGLETSRDTIYDIEDIFGNAYHFDPPLVNVVGVKPGVTYPENAYLVGAHYDSVNNPGADDDASGVAAVMEAARVLSAHSFDSTLVFVAFDGEEDGLFGSMHYAEFHHSDHNLPDFTSELLGMISLDMIAYNQLDVDHDVVSIFDVDNQGQIKSNLVGAFADYGGGLTARDDGTTDLSDHAFFDIYGFDAALVIESGVYSNPHYHLPTDAVETPDYIDYAYATKITGAITGYLAQAAWPVGTVDVLTAGVADNQLTLDYHPGKSGGAVVTVRATDSEGLFAEDFFSVTVDPVSLSTWFRDNSAGSPGYAEAGSGWSTSTWCLPGRQGAYLGDYRLHAGGGDGSNTATWTLTGLPPGDYEVLTTWVSGSGRAGDAPYEVYDGTPSAGTLRLDVDVNQKWDPNEVRAPDGRMWEFLGPCRVDTGTLTVRLSDQADGKVAADAVWVRELPVLPQGVMDNRYPGFDPNVREGLSWVTSRWHVPSDPPSYLDSYRYHKPGPGADGATWTLTDLDPGYYEVHATWTRGSGRAGNAPYKVYDGTASGDTLRLEADMNQRVLANDVLHDGSMWELLRNAQTGVAAVYVGSGTLTVELAHDTDSQGNPVDGKVVADAVWAKKLPGVPADVMDNQHPGYAETGTGWWTNTWHLPGRQGPYEENYRLHVGGGDGSNTATWTLDNLAGGTYEVFATWTCGSGRASNAPYRVFDGTPSGGTLRLDVTMNQKLEANDATYDGHAWELLGSCQVTSGTLTVQLSDNGADGKVGADAIWVKQQGSSSVYVTVGAASSSGTLEITGGLSQFSRSENGTVPFPNAEITGGLSRFSRSENGTVPFPNGGPDPALDPIAPEAVDQIHLSTVVSYEPRPLTRVEDLDALVLGLLSDPWDHGERREARKSEAEAIFADEELLAATLADR